MKKYSLGLWAVLKGLIVQRKEILCFFADEHLIFL